MFLHLSAGARGIVSIYIFIRQVGPFQTSTGNRAKLKVKVRLNLHGIVAVESATVRWGGLRTKMLCLMCH